MPEHHAGQGPIVEREVPTLPVDALALAQLKELAADEDRALSTARGRAGGDPELPSPEFGGFLAWLAATVDARTVVEIGSAGGLGALWLLRGMPQRATLTSLEREPEAQELAALAFEDAGVTNRVRSIGGDPLEMLTRLSDEGYDLAVIHALNRDPGRLLDQLRRILRPGGVLVARGVAVRGGGDLRSRRAFVQDLIDDPGFAVSVIPVDGGTALATRRRSTEA